MGQSENLFLFRVQIPRSISKDSSLMRSFALLALLVATMLVGCQPPAAPVTPPADSSSGTTMNIQDGQESAARLS